MFLESGVHFTKRFRPTAFSASLTVAYNIPHFATHQSQQQQQQQQQQQRMVLTCVSGADLVQ
jgi:hypothetical protein